MDCVDRAQSVRRQELSERQGGLPMLQSALNRSMSMPRVLNVEVIDGVRRLTEATPSAIKRK